MSARFRKHLGWWVVFFLVLAFALASGSRAATIKSGCGSYRALVNLLMNLGNRPVFAGEQEHGRTMVIFVHPKSKVWHQVNRYGPDYACWQEGGQGVIQDMRSIIDGVKS